MSNPARSDDKDPLLSPEFDSHGFFDHGILYMINRVLFHPRGYALALDEVTGMFYLMGNGDEPWSFILPEDAENARWDAFNKLLKSVTKPSGRQS